MGMCVAGLGALGVSLVYILTRICDVLSADSAWELLLSRCLLV